MTKYERDENETLLQQLLIAEKHIEGLEAELKAAADMAAMKAEKASAAAAASSRPGILTRAELERQYAAIPSDTMEGSRARAAFREKHKTQLGL